MNIEIRLMGAVDLNALADLAALAQEAPQWPRSAYEAYVAPDPDNATLLRTGVVAAGHRSNTAAGPILGFACATLVLDGTQNLCQLDTLVVVPDARRCGIGAALMRVLLEWAAQKGARHFSLEVRASNAPAIALYQRFGLQPEGRRPRYYAHPEEDGLLLGIQVTAGTP